MYDDRIVIPKTMRLDILDIIHQGHLGITKCRARAKEAVWWRGISSSIEGMVKNCVTCAKIRPTSKEPLLVSSYPRRAWERVGMDLFELNGSIYLIVVCYRSRWPEIRRLTKTTSAGVIAALKGIFSTHGIPDLVISDNGPQFASQEFKQFSEQYNFQHITSSPKYPAANGEAERSVRTIKEILKKNKDPYLALLSYRTTPLQNGLSPSELLMGRKLRTLLPIIPSKLSQGITNNQSKEVEEKEKVYREKQAENFNIRHKTTLLPQLKKGENVWVRDLDREGVVESKSDSPRSYNIETPQGTIRRNRSSLVPTNPPENTGEPLAEPTPTAERRSCRIRSAPKRLIEED